MMLMIIYGVIQIRLCQAIVKFVEDKIRSFINRVERTIGLEISEIPGKICHMMVLFHKAKTLHKHARIYPILLRKL